ncbi:MarR family winged helix-turn-helix transcriptional regulator [bacterium]|nr:MarR family winged helix-turn-helix transcriptional regulator [bacterium]
MEKYQEFADCNGFRIRRIGRHISQLYDHALAEVGIKKTQFSLLAVLSNTGAITIQNLSKIVGAERTTLTRNLKILQRDHFVRSYSGDDKRERFVELSEKGLDILEQAYPKWKKVQDRVNEVLGDDKEIFKEIVEKLTDITKDDITI